MKLANTLLLFLLCGLDANAALTEKTTFSGGVSDSPVGMITAQLDGDPALEIITSHGCGIRIVDGDTGVVEFERTFNCGSASPAGHSAAVMDVDGDGLLEALVTLFLSDVCSCNFGPPRPAETVVIDTDTPTSTPQPDGDTGTLLTTPEPTDSAVRIAFEIDRAADVVVRIIDVTGRLVCEVADGKFAGGMHEISWDGRDRHGNPAPSGVYFAQVVTLEGTDSRRITLAR